MKTLKQYKKEQIKNPEFALAYEEVRPEMNIIRAMVNARLSRNMTQKKKVHSQHNGHERTF